MQKNRIGVAVVGCGRVGARRAQEAVNHSKSELLAVVDADPGVARSRAETFGVEALTDWRQAVADKTIGIIVAATPPGCLAEIAVAALESGKHVLVEKPMGRNVEEAVRMVSAAKRSGKILKVGFNHRYHPALAKAHELFAARAIGELINIRARYGHGGRPGYESEWRSQHTLAGGGELTDQGVHLADLIAWFADAPLEAFAYTQTAVWPVAPLEDNAFALLRFDGGAVASFHSSWTQWKNLFSFEVFGTHGSLVVNGVGESYGPERLTITKRNLGGSVPDVEELTFDAADRSWAAEWDDFLRAIFEGKKYSGTPEDGLLAMRVIEALYESARCNMPVRLAEKLPTDRG